MKLKKIANIANYRNLSDITLHFSDTLTYFVGENNLGKTNVFDMLNTIFRGNYSFNETDFNDSNEKIYFECYFEPDTNEIGFWYDDFSGDPIVITQEIDDRPIYNLNGHPVHQIIKNKFCYISLSGDFALNKELSNFFSKKKGYNYLYYLIEKHIESNNFEIEDIIHSKPVAEIKENIKHEISHLNIVNSLDINYELEAVDFLASMLFFIEKESGHHIDKSGNGLRRRLSILLHILGNISEYKNKNPDYIEQELQQNNLNTIIAIDEPELHLHPHWQRQLINEITAFNKLNLFDGMKLSLQFIIVTHSPYMLPNDSNYTINRFYRDKVQETQENNRNTCIKIASLHMNEQDNEIHDRFIDQFREAYFAQGVILVEGESDLGMLQAYNKKTNYIVDQNSISIIKLYGAGHAVKVYEWFKKLDIPVIVTLDGDQKSTKKLTGIPVNDIIYSNGYDLEDTIYEMILPSSDNIFKILYSSDIFQDFDSIQNIFNIKYAKRYLSFCPYKEILDREEAKNIQKEQCLELIQKNYKIDMNFILQPSTDNHSQMIHKCLWIDRLSSIKSMYEGTKLGNILIENNCYPEYLKDSITKIIEKITERM